ncbi:MAG TPA: response regulator, partial [Patescibacteria group bacterium]
PQNNFQQKTVLIVEDDKPLLNILKDRLTNENYTVVTAENGKEGLEKLKETPPDILLLDLMMPVMDGMSMLHHLREIKEFKKLPVIVLTNAGEAENITQTKNYYNAVEFLIKSNITLDQVVAKVKAMAW